MRITRPPVLGIDIGGVLVDRVAEGDDTSFFGGRPMETPAVAGALEAIPELLDLFEHRVHIVSKAGPKISELSRQWLGLRGAVGPNGLSPANVHFVRKRPEKAPICKRLGITHFIDDRLDVLGHLTMVPCRILFIGGLGENPVPIGIPADVHVTSTWTEICDLLRRDLADAAVRA